MGRGYAKFSGAFTFADSKTLPPGLVQGTLKDSLAGMSLWQVSSDSKHNISTYLAEWDKVCCSSAHPATPVLWQPSSDGACLALLNGDAGSETEYHLAFDWIACIAEMLYKRLDILLQGEIWYQGELAFL